MLRTITPNNNIKKKWYEKKSRAQGIALIKMRSKKETEGERKRGQTKENEYAINKSPSH